VSLFGEDGNGDNGGVEAGVVMLEEGVGCSGVVASAGRGVIGTCFGRNDELISPMPTKNSTVHVLIERRSRADWTDRV
jgi:hypothetical protein